ncbi:MAG: GNAT family N-acetyltransferase [Bacteroidota bacterium]
MIQIERRQKLSTEFEGLVAELVAFLAITDGDEHAFYHQFNGLSEIKHYVLAYTSNHLPIGCGAFKPQNRRTAEIKRMYVKENYRRNGAARKILQALEDWALELKYDVCILETGKRQTEAASFYKDMGYSITANYSPYEAMENSICFRKYLKRKN